MTCTSYMYGMRAMLNKEVSRQVPVLSCLERSDSDGIIHSTGDEVFALNENSLDLVGVSLSNQSFSISGFHIPTHYSLINIHSFPN
jgi:hypothetical protein